jgi:ectoine hydroxylase-related dioxygenase (phytanoyl-CoA dioxygenase family)
MDCIRNEIAEWGFTITPGVLSSSECRELLEQMPPTGTGVRGGRRLRIVGMPAIDRIAARSPLADIASEFLGRPAFPVRAIYFDKTAQANWKVAWHQDLTVAVRERVDVPGFGPWSVKDGIAHVQPPVDVLERMVTLRLHLDDCAASHGPLRVIPRSHTQGRLSAIDISAVRARSEEQVCVARTGDVLAMKPLLLHASSAATEPGHRRVLHIEYAADPLPGGLEWFERCA